MLVLAFLFVRFDRKNKTYEQRQYCIRTFMAEN